MNILIALPARGRPDQLKKSVDSCFDLAYEPFKVEVVVRLDNDDPTLDESLKNLSIYPSNNVKIIVGERLGYAKMNEYFQLCAESSTGTWIVNWNDDMAWMSRFWDKALSNSPIFPFQFPRLVTSGTVDFTVPVYSREMLNLLKTTSHNAYCDAWLSHLALYTDTAVIRDDVTFSHDRPSDQTLRDQGLIGDAAWAKFISPEQVSLRVRQMGTILKSDFYENRFVGFDVCAKLHRDYDLKYEYIVNGSKRRDTSTWLAQHK